MKAVICLNGNPPDKELLHACCVDGFIIAADGACSYLMQYDLYADLIVGDFDSIPYSVARGVLKRNGEIIKHQPQKDYTDGQLALQEAISRGFDDIILLGAMGGRADHQYENIRLLCRCDLQTRIKILDNMGEIRIIHGLYQMKLPINTTVSILPYSDSVTIKRIEGFAYPALDLTLTKMDAFSHSGLSNLTTEDNVLIEISDGKALLFVNYK